MNAFALDGPGRLVSGLAENWLKEEGVSVRVAALTRGGPLQRVLSELGVETDLVNATGSRAWRIAGEWARKVGGTTPPDVLHTHLARPDLAGPVLGPLLGAPRLVSTNHGLHAWGEKGRVLGWIYRKAFRLRQGRFARIVAVSRTVAEHLAAAGIHPGRITIIPNGIDPEVFRPAPRAEKREIRRLLGLDPLEGFLLLMVGNLIPLKGHEYVLRAMPRIVAQHPEIRLLVIGEGPLEDSLRSLVKSLGIEHAVKRISPLAVLLPRVMDAADLLVHPSLTESFGLVVAEAQASGLPVVATRIGGPAEIVVDGETGYLVPEEDPDAIAEAVLRLVSNFEVLREMGTAGRQRVLQLYDIRRCAKEYLNLFRTLCRVGQGTQETKGTEGTQGT
jgi:glycosyltransferase involved in cell wall biosynthesis